MTPLRDIPVLKIHSKLLFRIDNLKKRACGALRDRVLAHESRSLRNPDRSLRNPGRSLRIREDPPTPPSYSDPVDVRVSRIFRDEPPMLELSRKLIIGKATCWKAHSIRTARY